MFCRQCEQTGGGKGCTVKGVCGKSDDTAILQDLLIHALKGIAVYGERARALGVVNSDIDRFIQEALFTTVTNVDFDSERIAEFIHNAYGHLKSIKKAFRDAYKTQQGKDFAGTLPKVTEWQPADSLEGLIEQGRTVGVKADTNLNEDIRSLREILLYGLKGMAAYADHAELMGYTDEGVNAFFYKGLAALVNDKLSADDLVSLIMEFGGANLKCMEILDTAHTTLFGHPEPTQVSLGIKKGPAIIVSGHDIPDLKQLLEQTTGKGVNIYTHGEMLPTHAYPELKKYSHFIGHFGTAWQNQQKEFNNLPAAILMTTNCIQKPHDSYKDRIFTTGLVTWPGVQHINAAGDGKKNFNAVIEKALTLGGFPEDKPGKTITIGFARNTVLGVADKVIEAVKNGAIKHFFLIGGCDGAKPGRNYYTDLAEKIPQDCVILTLACGKFRFNTLDFGDIGGIPRLLDCGQCNDAYSAIAIASALAKAFKCGVNDLPLTFILSWYEQKAVCILLTLLSLGIKNIKLGPSLPAFITPNVLKILVEKFNIAPIGTPQEDVNVAITKQGA
ncbi:MAG: hydroxylamine reductase [Candidatus Omnitrophica bacterium]|nr:hydroxylamine reductase [Candidatus Omnitrophota bacterium]